MLVSPNTVPTPRRQPSPALSGSSGLPLQRIPSFSDFQVERTPKSASTVSRKSVPSAEPGYDEFVFRDSVARLLAAKGKPFAISGRIPLDPAHLILFFRSKSGITHSLDFPIDVDYDTPPALDVLIAACKPHPLSNLVDYPDHESLFYPPSLPLTASLEIANHPILEAVRNTLFPALPTGHYLTTVRDTLEVVVTGGRMGLQPRSLRNDGRVATINVTLPVRFRGGALVIHDAEGNQEKFYGRGGKDRDMEWTAFLTDCEYEVETVQKGCKMSISYGVFLRTFGLSGVSPEPLISPSDSFVDLLSPILNMSRGRKIAFYLANDYGVDPSDVLAESLVPNLKGGDSLLYHAIKLFKLTAELHWTAGGYIWPVDHTVEIFGDDIAGIERKTGGIPLSIINGPRRTPAIRGAFSTYADSDEEADNLRSRVEDSGAILLSEADISILNDWNSPTPVIGKERVPFVSGGEMEKLVVNVLLVAYVP